MAKVGPEHFSAISESGCRVTPATDAPGFVAHRAIKNAGEI
jgi:hypothetical protein